MASFGGNLRREREMRRVSLEEISETTKISVRFLDALENEDFAKLPGGIFVRSFIRAYANYLGLDADSVIAEYQFIVPPGDEADFAKFCVAKSSLKQKKGTPVVPWLVAIALLGGGYAIFRYAHYSSDGPFASIRPMLDGHVAASGVTRKKQDSSHSRDPQVLAASPVDGAGVTGSAPPAKSGPEGTTSNSASRPDLSSSAPQIASQADSDGGVLVGSAKDRQSPRPHPSSYVARAESRGELVLQVAANQPSWVAVEADGKTVFEHVLAPDKVRTLVAKNYFDVTTGNAQGTVLTLNGVTLKRLGRRGEVRRLHLTRQDLKRRDP
ncbi:MAG TPA: RodZ domain-containing protein [Terriglobia bacterium]|nr:RodZ domain-containing protein [Terriglobia bacterium]